MLERLWRKGNPLTLLVAMKGDTSTLENSMKLPQEVKNRATLQPRNCTIYPKDTDVVKRRDIYTPTFITAMSTIAKLWNKSRCPSTDEWINMWSIYTMEYYSAMRKDEYLPFAVIWMELEGIMLSELSQAEKDNYHMDSIICGK